MKKNKSYIAMTLLVTILIFSVAATCNFSEFLSPGISDEKVDTNSAATNDSTLTTDTALPVSGLIHGVVPTKVTAQGSFKILDTGNNVNAEFWNVGKLGGDQYSKVTGTIVGTDATAGGPITFDGTFSGGPNGDINITATYNNKNVEWNFKLKDGKEIDIFGNTITIDNPEAFMGWID